MKGKTVLFSGERDLAIGESTNGVRHVLSGPMTRLLNVSGVHEHIWGIGPEGNVFNIGYTTTGLFFEDHTMISEYKFHYMGSYQTEIDDYFDYYKHAASISGQTGLYDGGYSGIGNNCQNFVSEFFAGCN